MEKFMKLPGVMKNKIIVVLIVLFVTELNAQVGNVIWDENFNNFTDLIFLNITKILLHNYNFLSFIY